ncbi:MAG: glycoside-pentoside-hexuronide (GPH):cation symporter [Clostridia bacterium]
MENSPSPVLSDRVSPRTKWTYTLGGIGRDMAYALYANYLLTFILFTKSVTSEQFAAISTILIVCRIWDAINDPVMGGIIENTRSRFGKFKPWILIGVLSNAIMLSLIFSLPITGWAFVIAFVFLYLLWDITFTMNDIAYWAMLPSLTSNPKDRASLTSLANLFASIGAILTIALTPIFTAGNLTIGGSAVTAYAVIAIVISIIFIGCQVMTVIGVQEKPQLKSASQEKVGIKKMLKVLKNNDQLQWVSVAMLLYNLGSSLIIAFGVTYVYFEFGYNGFLVTIFTGVFAVMTILINILFPALAAKFSRKILQTVSLVLSVVGYLIFFLTGLLWKMNFFSLCVGLAFISLGQTLFYMLLTIAIANTVEYNEWKSGSRDEGIIFSIRPFMAKMGSSLQQLVLTIVYLAVGVTEITKQISDAENAAAAKAITEAQKLIDIENAIQGVGADMKLALRACMVFLPIALLTAAYFVFKHKFKIDEKVYNKMLHEIKERNVEESTE